MFVVVVQQEIVTRLSSKSLILSILSFSLTKKSFFSGNMTHKISVLTIKIVVHLELKLCNKVKYFLIKKGKFNEKKRFRFPCH